MTDNSRIIFEVHSYDGGFKPELIPVGRRPNYLPEPTGPNSTELELTEGNFAYELVQTYRAGRYVTWIGCFTAGIDRQLGPRGNYCGVGVWLIDLAPIYVGRLVRLLRDGAVEIARNSSVTDTIRERFQVLALDLPTVGWFVPFERLPDQLWKARFSYSGSESLYFSTPDNEDHALAVVSADILRHFAAKANPEEVPHKRSLYMRRSGSKLPISRLQELDVARIAYQEEDIVWDLCEAVHDPITKQNELRRSLEQQQAMHEKFSSDAREEFASLGKRISELDEQLRASESARLKVETVFASVSKFIPNIRQVPLNVEGLADVSSAELVKIMRGFSDRLDAINVKLNALKQLGPGTHSVVTPQPVYQDYEYGNKGGWVRLLAYALLLVAAVILLLFLADYFQLL